MPTNWLLNFLYVITILVANRGQARCTDELVKSSPVKFPVVWSKEGPVPTEGVLP